MRGSPVITLGSMPAGGPDFGRRFQGALAQSLFGRRDSAASVAVARLAINTQRMDALVAQLRATPDGARRMDSIIAGIQRRTDGTRSGGFHMARQLEHIYAEVLREEFPVGNAFLCFDTDNSVPPGAETHTVRRIYAEGEATIYRGGSKGVPRVAMSQQEERFPVRHYVTSFGWSLFDNIAAGFANSNLISELLRVARDVVMERANLDAWYGSKDDGLYGVLDYPWLAKKVVATPFTGAASADDVMAALNALANFPVEHSKSTFRPNTLVVSPRVRGYLMNTRLPGAESTTIGKFWLENNSAGIKTMQDAWELQGKGPGGTDGVLFYRRDRRGVVLVLPQAFTTLPVQSLGFEDTTFAYQSTGGAVMRDVGNNILGWVDAG